MEAPKSPLARSSSRKKRSTTNLADLRLAPLSSKYAGPPKDRTAPSKSPYDESQTSETYFARQHSSYLQGKSAPTTPGILSRSSSRTRLGGGLSRQGSLHDDEQESEPNYAYAAVSEDQSGRLGVGHDHITKAKSEAQLHSKHSKSRSITSVHSQKKHHSRRPTGEQRKEVREDDWLTRTGAATNAMLQESKGQSWLSSRDTSAAIAAESTDDDEGYEEAAALSAWSSSAAKLRSADPNLSPTASRSASRWGSRYGSRPASRKTSRRGSLSGRTPLANPDNAPDYFTQIPAPHEDEITSPFREAQPDEDEVARLTSNQSFGLGGIVDRFMGFNLFTSDERESATEDEVEPRENESAEQAKARRAAEAKRRRDEKEKLVAPRAQEEKDELVQGEGGWSDAAWLLSVASKAMF